jgi:hypothetical protein
MIAFISALKNHGGVTKSVSIFFYALDSQSSHARKTHPALVLYQEQTSIAETELLSGICFGIPAQMGLTVLWHN